MAMNDSMAQRRHGLSPLELPGWKTTVSWLAAFLLACLFLVSGLWKITDAPAAAVRMVEARVPESLSLSAALASGIAETLAGVLILVPRFRRWGAILVSLLLVAFLLYFAFNYGALRGADCSCFPWVKRVVGPGFFLADGAMLVLAVLAGFWSPPSGSLRSAVLVLGAVVVFALVSYGVDTARQTATRAPAAITVDGRPYSLASGTVFLFFFDPRCMHCFDAAKRMAQFQWGDTRVVAVPVEQPQNAAGFLEATGLNAAVTEDFEPLKKAFGYTAYPYGVALRNGRRTGSLTQFDGAEPASTLKKLGLIE
jgi:uncharacterized membrane protein YphA (DoxX/SURF4 family)